MFRTLGRFLARFDRRAAKRGFHKEPEYFYGDAGPQYAMLACPAIAFGLGCWQVQRRSWKLALIEDLEAKTSAPPTELPTDLREVEDMEYRTVRVRGTFDHDEEVYIHPRSDKNGGGIGSHVVTPLKLEDRDYSILVNRGWVPRGRTNPATRREGQVTGVVEIEGIVRGPEKKSVGTREIRDGAMFSIRDIEMIARTLGTAPIFIDAVQKCTIPGGPIAGQTRIELRNEHFSYIVTWFGLSALLTFMWIKRYRRLAR